MTQPTINTPLRGDRAVLPTNFLGKITATPVAPVLTPDSNGIVYRYEGSSNITIAVPNNLPEGFNVGFLMYGTGTITISGGTATNRGGKSALNNQYSAGSLLVTKNVGGAAAEYMLGGDFT